MPPSFLVIRLRRSYFKLEKQTQRGHLTRSSVYDLPAKHTYTHTHKLCMSHTKFLGMNLMMAFEDTCWRGVNKMPLVSRNALCSPRLNKLREITIWVTKNNSLIMFNLRAAGFVGNRNEFVISYVFYFSFWLSPAAPFIPLCKLSFSTSHQNFIGGWVKSPARYT